MPSLDTAIADLNRAAQDLAEVHQDRRKAQEAYDEALKKLRKEHDKYWASDPSDRNTQDLRNAEGALDDAISVLNQEQNRYEEKLRAFLIAQQAYFLAIQSFVVSHM